jgi:hypothetical protein
VSAASPIDLGNSSIEGFRLRSCAAKVAHTNRRAAKRVARLTNLGGSGRLHAYSCRFCLSWHVGHPMSYNRRIRLVPS